MSSESKWRLVIAFSVMLIAIAGCQRRQYYAAQPLSHSQHVPDSATGYAGYEIDSTSYSELDSQSENDSSDDTDSTSEAVVTADEPDAIAPQDLTPQQAAEFAVLNHPALRTVRAERGIACAQIIQAGILPNPQLSASFDVPAFGATTGTVTGDAEAVSWDISKLRPLQSQILSATANASSVDMDIVWQEWQFAQTARQAVYDLAALKKQLEALHNSQRILEENLKLVEKAVDEGNLTIVESAAAQSAAIAARTATLVVEQEIRQQHVVVNRALGRPPTTPVNVSSTIEFPDELEILPVSNLLLMAEDRADIQSIRQSYESQEQALQAAAKAQIPTTNVSLTRASDTGEVGTLGAGVSIDLQLFDRNQGAIAAARAQRNKALQQYDQQVFTARSEVDSALANIRSLERQVATVQKAIPVFQELVDTYDKAVKQKDANVLVYYLAFNDMTQQRVNLWQLRRQLIDAKIALETAIGRPLE